MKTMTRNNTSRIWALLLAVLTVAVLALPVLASYPKADGFTADEAGVLAESTVRQIKKTNETLKKEVGVTIAVCTVKTTGDVAIDEYARGLFTEWKMGEGVLLLIASEDENYYFVQSTGVESVLTNADLEAIRDGYLEEDFAAGNIDSGVLKTFSKLTSELEGGIDKLPADGDTDTDQSTEGEKENGSTLGKVLVTILKIILYIALIALAAFVILFIVAMFNDGAAALLQRYVFRRGKSGQLQQTYYDERLYGNRNQGQRSQQRPQNRQPSGRQPGSRPQNGQSVPRRNPNQMYNADGTPRRPQNSGNRSGNSSRNGNYNDYNY